MAQTGTSRLQVTTPSDLEIAMTRTFDAPRHLVFDAWTKCEHLSRWFGPRTWELAECEIDLRPSGKWRWVLRNSDSGEQMGLYGEYREISPPKRLVQTENFDPPWFEEMGSGSLNTLLLEEHDGKTTMTATSLYKSKDARDGVLKTGFDDGANESFDRLAELLGTLT